MPGQFEGILDKLQTKLGKQTIKRASTINRPRPKFEVQQIKIFNEFNRRNPKADGGSVNGSEQAAFRAKVEELMDDGYDFGEAVREAMRQGYQDGGIVDEVILTQIKEKFPEFDASKSKFGFAKKDPRYEKVRGMYRKLSGAYKAYDEKRKTDPKRIQYRKEYVVPEETLIKKRAREKAQYKADPKKYLARNRKYVTRPDVALKRRKRAQERYYYGGQKEKDLARLKKVIASKNVSGYLQNTDNILLKDMIRAANQGDPNLKLVRGGPNNSVVAVQEGNKTYHAVGAQRKPVPGSPKNSIPITKHPTFKKRFEFVKQQKAFANTKIPGTDLTYGKALDFLESEKAGTPLQNKNAAEFEHVKGVRTDYKKGQVALRTANREKMTIRAALDNKNITLKEADKALKKIGVRDFYKGRYIGAPKINPNKQFDDLKKYVDKSFKLGKLKPIFKRIAKAGKVGPINKMSIDKILYPTTLADTYYNEMLENYEKNFDSLSPRDKMPMYQNATKRRMQSMAKLYAKYGKDVVDDAMQKNSINLDDLTKPGSTSDRRRSLERKIKRGPPSLKSDAFGIGTAIEEGPRALKKAGQLGVRGASKVLGYGAIPLELYFMNEARKQGKSTAEILAMPLLMEGRVGELQDMMKLTPVERQGYNRAKINEDESLLDTDFYTPDKEGIELIDNEATKDYIKKSRKLEEALRRDDRSKPKQRFTLPNLTGILEDEV